MLRKIENFYCHLIGWNPEILAECSEASFALIKKYVSAIFILSLLWGTIGYCFAEKYLGFDDSVYGILGKLLITIAFIFIIIAIERQIILTFGKLKTLGFFRIILALLMAILGATIFDQIIFENDIKMQMNFQKEKKVENLIPTRLKQFREELEEKQSAIIKLTSERDSLLTNIAQYPTIHHTEYEKVKRYIKDNRNGEAIYDEQLKPKVVYEPNGNIERTKNLDKDIQILHSQCDTLRMSMREVRSLAKEEIDKSPIGFIDELIAMKEVIFQNEIAILFYFILFTFLVCLEMLVLVSHGDGQCEYTTRIIALEKSRIENINKSKYTIDPQ